MKKRKRSLAVLLILMLVAGLTGCGISSKEKETETTVQGRLVEKEVEIPKGMTNIFAMGKLSDGSIEIFGNDYSTGKNYIAVSDKEGENWQVTELENLNYSYISAASVAENGSVAIFGSFWQEDKSAKMALKIISPEKEIICLNYEFPDTDDSQLNQNQANMQKDLGKEEAEIQIYNTNHAVEQCAYDISGNLFVKDIQGNIYKMNTSTGEMEKFCGFEQGELQYFTVEGKRLYAINQKEVNIYSTEDGSELLKDDVLNQMIKENPISGSAYGCYGIAFTQEEDKNLVYVNHQGLFYHQEQGSISEQLIDANNSYLCDNTISFHGIEPVGEASYLVGIHVGETSKLLKYTYDENAEAVVKKQLNIYALEDSELLRQVVSKYRIQYPDVMVQVTIGMDGNSGITAEEAIRTLNTEILAGKGPDVLVLDGMPVESYIQKGMLADISPVLETIEKEDGIFTNIKEVYTKNGKVYSMPSRFLMEVVEGEEDTVASATSLQKLAAYGKRLAEEGKGGIFPDIGAKGILMELYQADSANWLGEDGTIQEESLKNYLEAAGTIYNVERFSTQGAYEEFYESFESVCEIGGTAQIYVVDRLTGWNRIAFGTLGSVSGYRELLSIEAKIGGINELWNTGEKKSFLPYFTVGIVSTTEKQQEAEDFLKMVFSRECGEISGYGFPVNRGAYNSQCDALLSREDAAKETTSYTLGDGTEISYETLKLSQEDIKLLTSRIESLNGVVITDRIIQDFVLEEGMKYLKGEQSLEEIVTEIMQKANLYLTE
jgi:ABC-type glycerol-3-phosphate transport system substrate-binding protein